MTGASLYDLTHRVKLKMMLDAIIDETTFNRVHEILLKNYQHCETAAHLKRNPSARASVSVQRNLSPWGLQASRS